MPRAPAPRVVGVIITYYNTRVPPGGSDTGQLRELPGSEGLEALQDQVETCPMR